MPAAQKAFAIHIDAALGFNSQRVNDGVLKARQQALAVGDGALNRQIVNGVIDIMLAFSNDWCQMAYHDIELTLTGRGRLDDLVILTTHSRHEELETKILGAIPDLEA